MAPGLALAAINRAKGRRQALDEERAAAKDAAHPVNNTRLLSLHHRAEVAAGKEICIDCTLVYDSGGLLIGAQHYRLPLALLEARLLADEASVDPAGKVSWA